MNPKVKKILLKIWPFNIVLKKIDGLYEEISRLNKLCQEKACENTDLKNMLDNKVRELNDKNEEIRNLNTIINEQYYEIIKLKSNIKQSEERYDKLQQENYRLASLLKVEEAKSIKVDSGMFWDNVYKQGGNSGTGSYGHLAQFKADVVNKFLRDNNIKTAIELGCGDGYQLSLIHYEDYTGVDISPYIVEKLKEKYINDSSKRFYCSLTERDKYINNKYDVSISMDVIFHLLEDNSYIQYMEDLFSLSSHYVIIYSSNHEEFTRWPEFRHRKFMAYVQKHFKEWALIKFIPNKYPYIIGQESETSTSDFYIFEKKDGGDV